MLELPLPYIAPTISPPKDRLILQLPVPEATKESDAVPETTIDISPSPLTPSTAFPVQSKLTSLNQTT